MKIILFIAFVFILSFKGGYSGAQNNNIKFRYKEYLFQAKYDTASFTTVLKIKKRKNVIFKKTYYDRITEIKDYDLDGNGKREILIQNYSGGAHCCTSLFAGEFKNSKFVFTDSVNWGNSFYEITDLNNDKKQEITGVNDMFAYEFTNYAQSQFNLLIFGFDKGKFINVTNKFPDIVSAHIKDLEEELKQYTDTGYKCMQADEDTFNTDAGAVKAILAAITAEYHTLGNVPEGYKLIDQMYACPDKDRFIQILKTDFKLN
ncbi:MAG: hypothetical protein JNJ56_01385 [Ignavibacteria bacterium]|nr:hypothetical protein [Ignavibacteria bacterium]